MNLHFHQHFFGFTSYLHGFNDDLAMIYQFMKLNQWISQWIYGECMIVYVFFQKNTSVQPPKFTMSRKMKDKNYLKHSKPAGRSE